MATLRSDDFFHEPGCHPWGQVFRAGQRAVTGASPLTGFSPVTPSRLRRCALCLPPGGRLVPSPAARGLAPPGWPDRACALTGSGLCAHGRFLCCKGRVGQGDSVSFNRFKLIRVLQCPGRDSPAEQSAVGAGGATQHSKGIRASPLRGRAFVLRIELPAASRPWRASIPDAFGPSSSFGPARFACRAPGTMFRSLPDQPSFLTSSP
jgi:hypothetical protein